MKIFVMQQKRDFDILGSQIRIQYKTALFGLRVWIFIQNNNERSVIS